MDSGQCNAGLIWFLSVLLCNSIKLEIQQLYFSYYFPQYLI
jgi:hypothetical protein